MAHTTGGTMRSEDMERCIQECLDCYSACTATAVHCLVIGGEHASREHQTALLDCAAICQTSADFMLRESPLRSRVCGLCAEACRRCEERCGSMANGDQTMLACAEACRWCAESCERMTGVAS